MVEKVVEQKSEVKCNFSEVQCDPIIAIGNYYIGIFYAKNTDLK